MYSEDIKNLALKLYNKLLSLRKVAEIINIHFSTISRWNNYVKVSRKHRSKKLDGSDITDSITLFIKTHPFCSLRDIQTIIKNTFNKDISLELIRLFLIRNKFSKKRARYYSEPKDDEKKLGEFLDKRNKFITEKRNFISIDETSFGRNYLPAIGYSKKGSRLNVKRPFVNIITHSVLCAVSINNPIYFYKKEGSFNSESFANFIDKSNFPKKSVILLDNVRFHHSKIVKEIALKKELELLYVPPYSPIFNPIEGVFSIVKRYYQKYMFIEKSFEVVTNDHIKAFFKQSFNATKRF